MTTPARVATAAVIGVLVIGGALVVLETRHVAGHRRRRAHAQSVTDAHGITDDPHHRGRRARSSCRR